MSSRGSEQEGGGCGRTMEAPAASWHVAGVRITPSEVRFVDAVPGGHYRALLSIQNLQSHSCLLRLMPPEQPQVGRQESVGAGASPELALETPAFPLKKAPLHPSQRSSSF